MLFAELDKLAVLPTESLQKVCCAFGLKSLAMLYAVNQTSICRLP
jgi:hypothetical protein